MFSKIIYYGSIVFLGMICFILIRSEIQVDKEDRAVISQSYQEDELVSELKGATLRSPILEPIKSKTWETLQSLKFHIYFDEDADDVHFEPISNSGIDSLDGQVILLEGYIYGVSDDDKALTISCIHINREYQCCTSCSNVGAEDVVQISSFDSQKINLDYNKKYTFKGKLKFNTKEHSEFPYQLIDVSCLSC